MAYAAFNDGYRHRYKDKGNDIRPVVRLPFKLRGRVGAYGQGSTHWVFCFLDGVVLFSLHPRERAADKLTGWLGYTVDPGLFWAWP